MESSKARWCQRSTCIYRISKAIENQTDVTILKIKDYIENPKPNGYMSYHMIVSIPIFLSNSTVNTKVEIQIRTIAMDFWASLEHKIYYKYEGKAPESIRNDLKECADLVAYLDKKMLGINEDIKKFSNEPQTDLKAFLPESLQESYGRIIEDDVINDSYEEVVAREEVDAPNAKNGTDSELKESIEDDELEQEEQYMEAAGATFITKIPFGKRDKKAAKSKANRRKQQYQQLS